VLLSATAQRFCLMSAEPDVSSAQIHIEQLEIFARVGVPEPEREKPQRLAINITLWPTHDVADMNDRVDRTVNYSAVSEETKKFAREQSAKLIETLADGIAAHLLKVFPIRKISVELRKFVLPDAQYAAVTVTRSVAEN
jgi:7,8-dihydroneopterin aldolase/epimerase/oxygenase